MFFGKGLKEIIYSGIHFFQSDCGRGYLIVEENSHLSLSENDMHLHADATLRCSSDPHYNYRETHSGRVNVRAEKVEKYEIMVLVVVVLFMEQDVRRRLLFNSSYFLSLTEQ